MWQDFDKEYFSRQGITVRDYLFLPPLVKLSCGKVVVKLSLKGCAGIIFGRLLIPYSFCACVNIRLLAPDKADTSTAIPKYVHKTWLLNLFDDYEFPNK